MSRSTNNLEADLILIGESPSRIANPRAPLYPAPEGCSGARLCDMTGLTHADYLKAFGRVNLIHDYPAYYGNIAWSRQDAEVAARSMLPFLADKKVILLGRKVGDAFDYNRIPWMEWYKSDHYGIQFAVMPHPSARNRWYNTPANRAAAIRFLRETVSGKTGLVHAT